MRIAIFGGSFDPIHYGHLLLAQYAYEELELDRLIFMPSYRPPHKVNNRVSSFSHRYEMLKLALAGREDFVITTLEKDRQELSYSYDSLRILEKEYHAKSLHFLIGADSLMGLESWYRAKDLLENYAFAVAPRPGRSQEEIEEKIRHLEGLGGSIRLLSSPYIEISSSLIRERLEAGRSIRYHLPRAVEDYIYEKKVYGQSL